jgi:2-desacetyl-2-hydroxyethyl bacteriochlorophyllide A dehydrogenase
MKALIFADVEDIRHETVPDPKILDEGDVIVRVLRTAICGSDLHVYHGRERGLDAGTVMGHEFVGEIVEAGRDVKRFRPGDMVCSPFSVSCGQCFFCARGLTARCDRAGWFFGWVQNGVGLHGAQAEFVRVPFAEHMLVPCPANVSPELAVLLGDNFATGFFCADMAEVAPGGTYVVIGCGLVGLFAILAARERGAATIIAVDLDRHRRWLARSVGASIVLHPDDAIGLVHFATSGRGVDAVLEAVGSPAAQQLAMKLIRPCGILAVVGMHTSERFSFSPFDAYNKNLTYKTGRCSARAYMERLAPLLEKHAGVIAPLLSHRMPLSAGADAYRLFDARKDKCTKIILDPAC